MASVYQWIDLFFKNSKVIIAMYALLCGFAGYTIYDFLGVKNETKQEIQVSEIPPFPILKETPQPKIITQIIKSVVSCEDTCAKIMEDHVEEFH